jgi:hypothetical protein
MSDTPRTDAAEMACFVQDVPETFLGFARDLERENAVLRNKLASYEGQTRFFCQCGGIKL